MKQRMMAGLLVLVALPACVSEIASTGREVTGAAWDGTKWVSGQVWDGTKWVGRELYYGVAGNRPERLDLNQEIYASSDHTMAYVVDFGAQEYLGYAFDLGRDRKKSAGRGDSLTTDEVDWILWMLDGPEKDLYITTDDARIGYTEVVNKAAPSVTSPIGIQVPGRDTKAPPAAPSWVK